MQTTTADFASPLLFPFEPRSGHRRFGPSLAEMVQLERVCDAGCGAEAAVTPGAAGPLQAVAEHARAVEPWLRDIAAGRGVDAEALRASPPRMFERDTVALLRQGLTHAEDIRDLARADGDVGLFSFCVSWLSYRKPLVDAAVVALLQHD